MMMMLLLGQVRFNFFRARQNFGPATACSPLRTDTTTTHYYLPPHLFHHRTQSFVFHAHDEIVLADDGTGGFSSQSNPCFDTSPA
jgi:hypothetical protein